MFWNTDIISKHKRGKTLHSIETDIAKFVKLLKRKKSPGISLCTISSMVAKIIGLEVATVFQILKKFKKRETVHLWMKRDKN